MDAIGISILSGAHMTLFPDLIEMLRSQDAEDIVVFGGGIVPPEDITQLRVLGVKQIFIPGTHTQEIISWIRNNVPVS